MKPTDQLSQSDFAYHPVWEFICEQEDEFPDETWMQPVKIQLVDSLSNRVVGTLLTLSCGRQLFGILENIDLLDPKKTEHFLALTLFDASNQQFDLARYHDVDYQRNGPTALAAFLNLPVESIFPISYDISKLATGNPACLKRKIPAAPVSRLSQQELIDLAVRSDT